MSTTLGHGTYARTSVSREGSGLSKGINREGKLVWKRGRWDVAWRWSGLAFSKCEYPLWQRRFPKVDLLRVLRTPQISELATPALPQHIFTYLLSRRTMSDMNVSTDLIHPTHAQQRTCAQKVHATTHTHLLTPSRLYMSHITP